MIMSSAHTHLLSDIHMTLTRIAAVCKNATKFHIPISVCMVFKGRERVANISITCQNMCTNPGFHIHLGLENNAE